VIWMSRKTINQLMSAIMQRSNRQPNKQSTSQPIKPNNQSVIQFQIN
jgi:hypothetical protein